MEIIEANKFKFIDKEKLDNLQYYIYVIENDNGAIKIGRTHNIKSRLASLSNSNAGGSTLVRCAVSPATYLRTIETSTQEYYNRYRVKGSEWFIGVTFEEVVKFIDDIFNKRSYNTLNDLRRDAGGYTRRIGKTKLFNLDTDDED